MNWLFADVYGSPPATVVDSGLARLQTQAAALESNVHEPLSPYAWREELMIGQVNAEPQVLPVMRAEKATPPFTARKTLEDPKTAQPRIVPLLL